MAGQFQSCPRALIDYLLSFHLEGQGCQNMTLKILLWYFVCYVQCLHSSMSELSLVRTISHFTHVIDIKCFIDQGLLCIASGEILAIVGPSLQFSLQLSSKNLSKMQKM